ncbi:thiol reductant ABC exporter subunit CydC [Millisia brevis]|uniref:thiol reductant ABC exporter subunit CydC n=1 Tax=Millisia brevis TaxID=264148 RepID=UPI000836A3F2|nr:thiol reductant ABC exporter subunit CydC [Millisia brevis]
MTEIRRAIGLLGLDRTRLTRSIVAGSATQASALFLAALAAWLIARAWEMPPVLDLTVAVVTVRALGIGRGIFRYLERLASHDVALRGSTTARATLYRILARGNPAAVTASRRGDLVSRTGSDVDTVAAVVVRAIVPMAVAVVASVVAVVLLTLVVPAAGLVLLIGVVVCGVVVPLLVARGAARAERESVEADAVLTERVVTVVDHAPELLVAGRLDRELDEVRAAADRRTEATDRSAAVSAFGPVAPPLAAGLTVLCSILVGAAVYANGGLSAPAFAVAVLFPLAALEAAAAVPEAAVALVRARAAAGRVVALVDAAGTDDTRIDGGTDAAGPVGEAGVSATADRPVATPELRARGLRAAWPGGPGGMEVDIDLAPGDRLVVVGPSGAGKSALLATLAGLLAPAAGTVTLDGHAIDDLDPHAVRRDVVYFAEDAHLFETTVLENLRVARGDLDTAEAERALRDVGLGTWLDGLADGLDTVLVGGAAAVSAGQRRRLLLARALISPARILLLDEPTEHLDDADGLRLQRALLDPRSGVVDRDRTVVVAGHRDPDREDRVLEVHPAARSVDEPAVEGVPTRAQQPAGHPA